MHICTGYFLQLKMLLYESAYASFVKSGDATLFTIYRLISLLPSASKVVERVSFNQVHTYFETKRLFHGSKNRFCKRHSTKFDALSF